MILRIIFILFYLLNTSPSFSNSFSEIFGSEGAAGIENPRTRSLSYTFQYLTLSGSIGYVAKQLFESGFMQPIGLIPKSISNMSPLAYENDFYIDSHNANILAINNQIEKINHTNELKQSLFKSKFSVQSLESRNKSNFANSSNRLFERNKLISRYLDE